MCVMHRAQVPILHLHLTMASPFGLWGVSVTGIKFIMVPAMTPFITPTSKIFAAITGLSLGDDTNLLRECTFPIQ